MQALPAGNDIARQPEPLVIPPVDVADQFIDRAVIPCRGELDGFFKRLAAGQKTTQAQESTATQTDKRQ